MPSLKMKGPAKIYFIGGFKLFYHFYNIQVHDIVKHCYKLELLISNPTTFGNFSVDEI